MSENKTNHLTAATTDAAFLASDADMVEVERQYQQFEQNLQAKINNIERDHPGYHKYNYQIDPIGHDPYVLMAICSAVKPNFKPDDAEIIDIINKIKAPRRQYTLTLTPSLASDYTNQFTDEDIDSIDRKYLDLNIRLVNYGMNCIIDSILSHDQICAYAAYLRSHGMRPYLFPQSQYPNATIKSVPRRYQIEPNLISQYPLLGRELAVANQYIGYPYVWGGASPDTSFDCSGYITFVVNQLGYNQPRTTAQGIYDYCTPVTDMQSQPGDLIFFKTPDAKRLDHVGIYVGNDEFLHSSPNREESCVHYSNLNDKCLDGIWRDYFVGFARLPQQEQ